MENSSATFKVIPNENQIISVGGPTSIGSEKIVLIDSGIDQTFPQTGEVTNLYSVGGGLFFIVLCILLLRKKKC